MEDYAFSKLKERYKKWTGNSFADKDLISFGMVNEQGELTNAGHYLLMKVRFFVQDYFVQGGMD